MEKRGSTLFWFIMMLASAFICWQLSFRDESEGKTTENVQEEIGADVYRCSEEEIYL